MSNPTEYQIESALRFYEILCDQSEDDIDDEFLTVQPDATEE